MKGIYAVSYVPPLFCEYSYTVQCYKDATDVILMNYLLLIQENTVNVDLSDESMSELKKLVAAYWMERCSDVVSATIFFFKSLPYKAIEEVEDRYGDLFGKTKYFETEEEYNQFMEENSAIVKHVTVKQESDGKINSYCTVKVPLAYLISSDYDCDSFLKQRMASSEMNLVDKILARNQINNPEDLNCSLISASSVIGSEPKLLLIVYPCMLVKRLLNKITSGMQINEYSYGRVIKTLLQEV